MGSMSGLPESVRVQTIKAGVYQLGGGRTVRVEVEDGEWVFHRQYTGEIITGEERSHLIDTLAVPAVW
jgi:co-chaperonin GroES (HSP10)